MVRPKKETVAAAVAEEAVVELIPSVEKTEEVKKPAGRGKRKGAKETSGENSPPKRTLRSNSKSNLQLVEEKEVIVEEKKARKAPVKPKKTNKEENGVSDATTESDSAPATNGKNEQAEDPAAEKADSLVEKGKGRKKNEKVVKAPKTEAIKETEEKAEKDEEKVEVNNDTSEKEKSKVVKVANGAAKGKKKAEVKTAQVEVKEPEPVVPEEAQVNGNSEEEPKEEKTASGKAKKKAEKAKEEEAIPKKTKKEATAKSAKASSNGDSEEIKETKPVSGEAKKAKGKGAKTKDV